MNKRFATVVSAVLIAACTTPPAPPAPIVVAQARPEPDCSKFDPERQGGLNWYHCLEKSRDVGQGWFAGCISDRVTLEWSCFAGKFFGSAGARKQIRVHHARATGYCFSGALNDHPGQRAVLRIGSNAPIRYEGTLICGAVAQQIVDQLSAEVEGATRGSVWPNKLEEFEFNSTGFPAALSALKERVAKPRW